MNYSITCRNKWMDGWIKVTSVRERKKYHYKKRN